jgi:hypothetical protein
MVRSGKVLNLSSRGYGDKFFEAFAERIAEMNVSLEVCSFLLGVELVSDGG